jgi:ABC-2 type transport system permease protein
MASAGDHLWRLWRGMVNGGSRAVGHEPIRALAVVFVILVTWAIIAGVVIGLIYILNRPVYLPLKPRLMEVLLALFLFTVQMMVIASDLVLVWSALFRTRSAAFHAALPFTDRQLFWGAAAEGGLWSGWAVLVLIAPLVGSLALESVQTWAYLPVATIAVLAFVLCCLAAGSLGALILARLIPLLRRGLPALIVLVCAGIIVGVPLGLGWLQERGTPLGFMNDVVGKLGFAESAWLPSWWTQQAITAAMGSHWADAWWYIALTVSTAAALAVVAEWMAGRRLRRDLDLLAGRVDRDRAGRSRTLRPLPALPADLGLLAAKDLRVFLRDPAQLIQVTVFFGLIGFYLLMLPRLGAAFQFDPQWKLAVSVLNLTAIGMALATFTGRFVYPMLSLEGRRLWMLCQAPWDRRRIVTAKLVFALVVGLPISVGLTILSCRMLDLPWDKVVVQAVAMACLCLGLAAASLGLGARYADYDEDNPAKLITGYGGTINLLLSLVFSALLIAPVGITMLPIAPPWWSLAAVAYALALTAGWSRWHLGTAWREFARAGEPR